MSPSAIYDIEETTRVSGLALRDDISRSNQERTGSECYIAIPTEDGSVPGNPRNDSGHDTSTAVADTPETREPPVPERIPYELWQPQLYGLHNQGWTILDLRSGDKNEIWQAISALLSDAKTFFATPETLKSAYGKGDSEEGWTKIGGEKEFITFRGLTSKYTPNNVGNSADKAWGLVFSLFYEILGDLAKAMKLEDDTALQRYCKSSLKLGLKNGASMIRIFRYENDTEFKVLAEGESDSFISNNDTVDSSIRARPRGKLKLIQHL
jgi:hypothetical protein